MEFFEDSRLDGTSLELKHEVDAPTNEEIRFAALEANGQIVAVLTDETRVPSSMFYAQSTTFRWAKIQLNPAKWSTIFSGETTAAQLDWNYDANLWFRLDVFIGRMPKRNQGRFLNSTARSEILVGSPD